MGRLLGALGMLCCSVVSPLLAQDAEPVPAVPSTVLVEIRAEMMVIGKEGSRRAGSESAVLPPEKIGLLRTSTSLPLGAVDPLDEVTVELRVGARRTDEGMYLTVDSQAQGQPSGERVVRSGGGLLTGNSPLLYEAYVSQPTGDRVVFLLSARPWEEPPPDLLKDRSGVAPRAVAYSVRIYRLTEEEPELLETPSLASLVGHTAGYSFGFTLEEEDGERREELQIRLQAVELRDGWLSGILRLEGVLGGNPVSRSRGWSLPSGGQAEIDLRLEGGAGLELGFRIRVDVRF